MIVKDIKSSMDKVRATIDSLREEVSNLKETNKILLTTLVREQARNIELEDEVKALKRRPLFPEPDRNIATVATPL